MIDFNNCPYRLCHPDVLVVKAAQDGHRYNASERLHGPPERCVLAEGQVRANIVVVAGHSSLATTQRYIQGDSGAKQNVVRMI
jgi:hypothetical protein